MTKTLTPQEALANLLDYVSADEATDYASSSASDRKNHIYGSSGDFVEKARSYLAVIH